MKLGKRKKKNYTTVNEIDKAEVIRMLKEHLKAMVQRKGCLSKYDKNYSIRYVMDFIPNISEAQAIQILEENIPAVVNL